MQLQQAETQPRYAQWQGEHIPCYYKDDVYRNAEEWLGLNRDWLKEKYGSGYLYLDIDSKNFVVSDSYDGCAELHNHYFGSMCGKQRRILSAKI